jgi:hypothetical protein
MDALYELHDEYAANDAGANDATAYDDGTNDARTNDGHGHGRRKSKDDVSKNLCKDYAYG